MILRYTALVRNFIFIAILPAVHNLTSAQTLLMVGLDEQNNPVLSWSGGTPYYAVVRADSPDFSQGVVTLVSATSATTWTDSNATKNFHCYEANSAGAGETGRVGELLGGLPQEEIVITEICVPDTTNCPASRQGGAVIAIGGTGFDADNPTNHTVAFEGISVPASGFDGETYKRLTVKVPTEAVSGYVSVSLGRVRSNSLWFTVTHGSGYSNITSLAAEGGTGSLFAGDRDVPALWEIFPDGSKIDRDGGLGFQNFCSNLTATGGTGSLFFGNGYEIVNNAGSIREFNSGTNGVPTAYSPTAGDSATSDWAWVRAMAAANINLIYFVDKYTERVRRVPRGGTKDTNWGNVGSGFFNFNHPAGARYASPNLYVSSADKIVRISDTESVSTLATGLQGAAGLDVQPTGTTDKWLIFAEKTSGKIRLMDLTTNAISDSFGGFTNPVAVVWARNATAVAPEDQGVFTYIATPTSIYRYRDPRLEVFPKQDIRVLISDSAGGGYPSFFQTEDAKVWIGAQVYPARENVSVTFEVLDPDDRSPYEADTTPNDNLDPTYPKGQLFLASTDTLCGSPCTALTDALGWADVDLKITERYSGDNYVVVARIPTSTAAFGGRTGIITAWKRVYVEHDKMFRQPGQDLTADAKAGQKVLEVADTSRFVIDEEVWIFDSVQQDGEKRLVDSKTATTLTLNANLSKSYLLANSAYVGKVSDGFYRADMSQLYKSFDESYVEFVVRPDGSGPVPYEILSTQEDREKFSEKWFKNKPSVITDRVNYIHVVGAEKAEAGTLGATLDTNNYSFIFVGAIEDLALEPYNLTPQEIANVRRSVTAHEIGHQFNLNTNDPDGHDTRNAWCSGAGQPCEGEPCLMKAKIDTSSSFDKNNVHEFCVNDLTSTDNPPNSIRIEQDPI